jgi:hypothetical protein
LQAIDWWPRKENLMPSRRDALDERERRAPDAALCRTFPGIRGGKESLWSYAFRIGARGETHLTLPIASQRRD